MIIYLITNKVNEKKYVGQHCGTTDSRWKQHLHAALKLEDPKPLYAAFRKYGIDNFTYEVLETLPKDANEELLDDREKYFIQQYDTFIKNGKGYNLTLGGDGQIGAFCRTQTKKKMSDSMDKTDYGKYDPETGDLIKIYNKLSTAAEENNIRNSGTIPTTAKFNKNEDGKYKSVNGFIWLSSPNGAELPTSIVPTGKKLKRKIITKKQEYTTELAQYAMSGLLINIWDEPPRDVANKLSIPYKSMLDVLNGKKKIAGGYFWKRFPIGTSPDEIEDKMEKHVITFSKRQLTTYPIYKIVSGREVMRYSSVIDAIIDNNLAPTEILNSLELGKVDSNGASWKWIERPNYIRHEIVENKILKVGQKSS